MTQQSPLLEVTRFAELGGYVLLDVAAVVTHWVEDDTAAHDLLPRLSDETEVERLAEAGGLLPIVVDEPDDITVAVYLEPSQPPEFDTLLGDESGWVLCAGDRGQQLLAIGYLMRWSVDSEDAASLTLPPGQYTVRARWGLRAGAPGVDLLLLPAATPDRRELPIAVAFD